MITYLAKDRFDRATYARAARQKAFSLFLSRVPGSVAHFSDVGGSSRSASTALAGLARVFAGIGVVWSARNPWVVVDYPNHPASVPRRMPVFVTACLYLASLRLVCRLRGARLVVQCDDDPWLQDASVFGERLSRLHLMLERAYERLLFGCADRVWFTSERMAEVLCPTFHVPASKVTYVPNGAPDPAHVDLPLPAAGFRFVYAGALQPETRQVRRILEAFAAVRMPDAQLVLLGPDGEWVPEHLAQHPDERVVYLGCLEHEEVQAVVARCDAGLLTGEQGGETCFPGKLGTYLGAGLPVLATCGGDVTALIEQYGVGAGCSAEELSAAMDALAADRRAHAEMRERAKALSPDYRWDAIFDRALRSLTAPPATPMTQVGSGKTAKTRRAAREG